MDRSKFFTYLFDFADVLVTVLNSTTKAIQAQIGDATGETPDSDDAEWWQQTGFASRPAVPTQGNSACQAVVLKHGDRDVIIATRDVRGTTIYGNLKDGETCVYASTGQARTLWKSTGDIWDITTVGNTAGGHTVARHLGADGSWAIQGLAAMISADAQGNITIGNAAACIKISSAGRVDIIGQIVNAQASGVAQISGGVATCLGPHAAPTPATACAYSSTGPVNLVSTNVFVSPSS